MLSFFGEHFFWKLFVGYDKSCIFALTKKKETIFLEEDPVVQLVRMPPCHGGGRGFESRPVRKKSLKTPVKTGVFAFWGDSWGDKSKIRTTK